MTIPPVIHPLEKTVYKMPTLDDCVYVSQPYGKQYYLWFTTECILVERRTKKETVLPIQFDPILKGTLIYGTVVYHESIRCFLFDDLFFDKGEQVVRSYLQKVDLFIDLILHIRPNQHCLLMLPLISSTYQGFDPIYKQYSVKVIHASANYHYLEQNKSNVFTVRSTPKSDIYELYTNNVLQSIAYIDTYKRSALMNTLFETVQEHRMECIWHEPFKKWIPDKLVTYNPAP
jgi:hypothetical protein